MSHPFELRHLLRELRQDIAPPPHLWEGIQQALAHPPVPNARCDPGRVRASGTGWILAAGLAAMTVLAIGLTPRSSPPIAVGLARRSAHAWQPQDPRLEGAAIELAAAQMELRLALQQAPSSLALQRLLQHTRKQQSRLQAIERQAG